MRYREKLNICGKVSPWTKSSNTKSALLLLYSNAFDKYISDAMAAWCRVDWCHVLHLKQQLP